MDRSLSPGKYRGLQRVASEDGFLTITAMDHRGALRRVLRPDDPESVSREEIILLKRQLARYINFSDGKALMLNNAEWLTKLSYIPFLRDIGRYFSVNRMIKAESCRSRLESEDGLSFIEFNYMVLQAYDFLELFDRHTCCLQMGGSDQWGNIVAGIDLIRRVRSHSAFGITFPLITTSSGAKMGKTASGAVWLDPKRTSPYDYYQFWVNTDDRDVARFLRLFTFLPLDEIAPIENIAGADLNAAKTVLAFEATRLAHGRTEAEQAYQAACEMFGARALPDHILPSSGITRDAMQGAMADVPSTEVPLSEIQSGVPLFRLLQLTGLVKSGGEARRLVQQGGAYLNGSRIGEFDQMVTEKDMHAGEIVLRAGKKKFHKIIVK
jgi:tyrosyl-tRNA synthetase